MSTIQLPATVDDRGNILVNGRGGVDLPVVIRGSEWEIVDASTRELYFEVKGVLREPLLQGAEAGTRRLVLSRADIAKLPKSAVPFVVVDETDMVEGELVPDVIWEGTITWRGYLEAPSV